MSDRNEISRKKVKESIRKRTWKRGGGGGLNQGKTYKGNRRLSSAHLRSFLTRQDSLSRIFANYYYWCGSNLTPRSFFHNISQIILRKKKS